ncbi:MAG: hypothetical protein LBI48_06815 [Burkholderiaceae bacterium]|nr:hypothetical protein [Burkholderiaceae bacterium]
MPIQAVLVLLFPLPKAGEGEKSNKLERLTNNRFRALLIQLMTLFLSGTKGRKAAGRRGEKIFAPHRSERAWRLE